MSGQNPKVDYFKPGFVLGLTTLTLLICWLVPAPRMGGEAGVLMDNLPYHIGPLYAFSEPVSEAEHLILPPDTTYTRKTYGSPDSSRNDRILCSIILSGAEKRSIHRPERCLPAQGWRIDSSHTESLTLASGHPLQVTALLLEKPMTTSDGRPFTIRSYFLYWFVGKGITTPSQTTRILMTNWDLLVHRVNQRWAYVIVSANITKDWRPDGLDPQETLDTLKQFIRDSAPYYMISEMPENQTASR
jgi:EpsI family protein